MPGPEKHDVTADPLTPYWRAKVEAAANVATEWSRSKPEQELPRLNSRDALFKKLWNAGAPYWVIAKHLGFESLSGVPARFRRLRLAGYNLSRRGHGFKPPDDWQQRVDEIMEAVQK